MAKFCCAGLPATACVALLTLVACTREGGDEMSWARAALERNNDIEVVAADPHSRTFTVRVKDTGELRMVRADEVVAGPVATAPATAPTAGSPHTMAMARATASPAAPTAAAAGNGTTAAGPASAAEENAEGVSPGEPPPATQPSSLVPQTVSGGGSTAGKVLKSGPGYTIQAAAPQASGPSGRVRETNVTTAALERRHEPIVCQGARLMHIDNRNLAFDGDAVSAEDGCEIHITNSHISAGGIGVLARAANVHIDNSLIEGEQGSIDASDGAQVYIAASRFRGLSRRLDSAAFHDLGGNLWN
jgi:hypothetical protein